MVDEYLEYQSTARLLLICFSSDRRTDLLYENWQAWLAPDLKVVHLLDRRLEIDARSAPGPQVLRDSGKRLLGSLRPLLDRPFAFYGHGLGALAAFETCRALEIDGCPKPDRLFVSGLEAPGLRARQKPAHELSVELVSARPRLDLPITVFCGAYDEEFDASCLETWRQLTDGECEICLLPGGNSFLAESGHLVASGLRHRCVKPSNCYRDLVEA